MRTRIKRLIALVSLLAVVLLSSYAGRVYGQAETGTINGTVTDSTGAVIPNAKVVVKNINTGLERPTVTDGNGHYSVSNLLPGTYSISAEAPNLAKKEIRAEVTVGARIEANLTLAVGVTSTVIEVMGAGGVQVNTETATIGTVIDQQQISQLPTLNRDPYAFAQYVGTASNGDPSGRGVGFSFNGLRSASTNILLDGAANNDDFTASEGQPIPLDSVQEYSILTSNFTAEFGRASAAVVNLATKGGTNDFHGSAYEYNRVSKLSADSFYNNANDIPKGEFTRNQFGASMGGPIMKNKLFFFGNVEWNRIRSNAQEQVGVIDPAFVALANSATSGFFSSLGKLRSNATVSHVYTFSQVNPVTKLPTTPCGATPVGLCANIPGNTPFIDKVNYSVPADAGAGAPENQSMILGRVDWNISDKTQFYGRYALDKESFFPGTVSTSAYTGYDTGQTITDNNILLSLTHSFNPRWTVQNKIVFNRLNNFQPLGPAPISPGLYFNPATATGTGSLWGGLTLEMPGYLPTTPGNGIPFGGPQNFLQLYQDWSHTMGRHTLRFGGSYSYERDNRTFGAYETPVGAFSTSGGMSNASLNRFLGGYWGQFQGAIYPQGNYPCPYSSVAGVGCVDPSGNPYPAGNVTTPVTDPVFARSNRYNEFALYAIDSWKMSNRLTLSLQLRYEYFGVQHNKNPQLDSNYYLGTGATLQEQVAAGSVMLAPNSPIGELWTPSPRNFAPRVGFAYDVSGDGKTVVRGGFGIAYERNFGNVTFNVIQNPPNYSVISLVDGTDVPVGSMSVTTNPAGPLSGSGTVKAIPRVSLRAVNPNIKQAYTEDYTLTVEHELRHNLLVGLDYSGNHAVHQYDIANYNEPGAGAIYFGDSNPFSRLRTTQYSNINWRGSNGTSHYNSLVARVQMNSFAKSGLTLNANYTYAHTMDDLSDTFSSSWNEYNLGYLNPFNPRGDYGNSYMDVRHRFTSTAIWEVPFAKSTHGWVKQVADGWTVTPLVMFETGFPFSIYDCTNAYSECMYAVNANGGGISRSAPSTLVPTGNADNFVYTNFYNGSTPLFNSSYYNPITGTSDFGPYPAAMNARNTFRGPGQWNVDMGISKTFFLTERFKLQFRGEMYNIFNHANLFLGPYGASGNNVDVSSLAYVDAYKDGHRTVQLALRLDF